MTDILPRLLALAELAIEAALQYDYGDPEDRYIYRELQELRPLVQQALVQPEPAGPSFSEIMQLAEDFFTLRDNTHGDSFFATDLTAKTDPAHSLEEFARAVLARWGTPPPPAT